VLVERSALARLQGDHGHRDRISLVLEKQRQVGRFDIPELDVHARISTKPVTSDK
jgi:hypothetical protein